MPLLHYKVCPPKHSLCTRIQCTLFTRPNIFFFRLDYIGNAHALYCTYNVLTVIKLYFTTAVSRIQKRLSKKVTPVAPPPFRYCSAPFSLLSPDLLVSQNSLLGLVHADLEYLKQQAKYVVCRSSKQCI